MLADLTMPVMTGLDMAREMFALRPSTKIAIKIGFSATWTAAGLRAKGIAGLLPKPLTVEALAKAMRAILDDHAPAAADGVA